MVLRMEGKVEFSAKEGDQVVMQPAAAVIAGVHDESLLVDILSQYFIECDAEAGVVHAAYVYIADAAAGEAIDQLLHAMGPAVVQQGSRFDAGLYGFYAFFVGRIGFWIVEADEGKLAGFMVQQG